MFITKFKKEILEIIQKGLCISFSIIKESKNYSKTRNENKKKRYQKFLEKYTIKGKVYENCQIQAPDGEVLCYADSKRVNWYIERSLAEIISKEPSIIRLNFEPNGRGYTDIESDQVYYSKEKKNECVCCGSTSSYLRYHIVPLLYRKYFPENYKSRRSHDIVLLCATCHETAIKHSDKLKKQIAIEYDVPLNTFGEIHKHKEKLSSIRKLCISIVKNNNKIPEHRLEFLFTQIQVFISNNEQYNEYFTDKKLGEIVKFLSCEENCKNLLKVYGNIDLKKELCNTHGKKVVEKLKSLKEFIRR